MALNQGADKLDLSGDEESMARMHPARILKGGRQKTVFALLVIFTVVSSVYFLQSSWWRSPCVLRSSSMQAFYRRWPAYDPHPPFPEEWYNFKCFQGQRQTAIEHLEENLRTWSEVSDVHCRELYVKFHDIYAVKNHIGEISIPTPFQKRVSAWLGDIPNAIELAKKQTTIHIFNQYTHKHSIHAPLRSKRPMKKPTEDPLQYVMKMAGETQTTCDFCNFATDTAQDIFGRHVSNHSFTAANVFKMGRWHGLVAPLKHNCVNLTAEDIVDVMTLAKKWFDTAHSFDRTYRYPMLSWDNTPHAGASQFHPHMQAFLDSDDYYGVMENLRRSGEVYFDDYPSRNYFTDLTVIHQALGLAETLGDATAIVELTERGDAEFVLLSARPNDDLYLLLFYIIRTFMEELQIFSFTAGMAFPILPLGDSAGSLPAIIRITTRGEVNNIFSEISGFDLYLSPSTSRDPYKLVQSLRRTIKKYEG